MEKNGSSLTFKPDAAGTYTIKAGIEINGTFSTAQLIVTVEAEATTINISGTGTLTAGQSTTLTATVEKRQRRHALGAARRPPGAQRHAGDLHGQRARHLPHPRGQQRCGQRLCADCQRRGHAGTHRCAHRRLPDARPPPIPHRNKHTRLRRWQFIPASCWTLTTRFLDFDAAERQALTDMLAEYEPAPRPRPLIDTYHKSTAEPRWGTSAWPKA